MSYTLQLPPAVVSDAKVYASSCGTTLSHLVKMYIIELSTRKPEMKKRKLGIADGECRIPTKEEDCAMDEEIATIFGGAAATCFLSKTASSTRQNEAWSYRSNRQ